MTEMSQRPSLGRNPEDGSGAFRPDEYITRFGLTRDFIDANQDILEQFDADQRIGAIESVNPALARTVRREFNGAFDLTPEDWEYLAGVDEAAKAMRKPLAPVTPSTPDTAPAPAAGTATEPAKASPAPGISPYAIPRRVESSSSRAEDEQSRRYKAEWGNPPDGQEQAEITNDPTTFTIDGADHLISVYGGVRAAEREDDANQIGVVPGRLMITNQIDFLYNDFREYLGSIPEAAHLTAEQRAELLHKANSFAPLIEPKDVQSSVEDILQDPENAEEIINYLLVRAYNRVYRPKAALEVPKGIKVGFLTAMGDAWSAWGYLNLDQPEIPVTAKQIIAELEDVAQMSDEQLANYRDRVRREGFLPNKTIAMIGPVRAKLITAEEAIKRLLGVPAQLEINARQQVEQGKALGQYGREHNAPAPGMRYAPERLEAEETGRQIPSVLLGQVPLIGRKLGGVFDTLARTGKQGRYGDLYSNDISKIERGSQLAFLLEATKNISFNPFDFINLPKKWGPYLEIGETHFKEKIREKLEKDLEELNDDKTYINISELPYSIRSSEKPPHEIPRPASRVNQPWTTAHLARQVLTSPAAIRLREKDPDQFARVTAQISGGLRVYVDGSTLAGALQAQGIATADLARVLPEDRARRIQSDIDLGQDVALDPADLARLAGSRFGDILLVHLRTQLEEAQPKAGFRPFITSRDVQWKAP
ncbi:hypothetical protein GCM10007276_34520 [Agaricicola taiwanensis]|uniref:Uncharacterized protein n=1 Tax=Agaricicola taiwanensis TaxID=591372 RepID=A0A8J3DZ90_9RHOB|nr:hypothetical protein [Agaricicola taiwanensis]GGE54572.1 hypothetical protein GCM10007276_34520 [Agaricicola taiwanensis]